MHLSLKGSMDRQPLTDRLGDRLLAEYGGAAAAYSLRALNGNGDNVVRVRRASDNNEKDFTAEQIELGEMVNWVNSQTVPPLDIGVETSEGRIPVPEGGTSIGTPAVAYSLRNLSSTYTGNVVDVRRSSDDAVESFTATEVADGTLEDWVNTDYEVYTSDFSTTQSWTSPGSSVTITSEDGIGGLDDVLGLDCSGTSGRFGAYKLSLGLAEGEKHSVTFRYYTTDSSFSSKYWNAGNAYSNVNVVTSSTNDQIVSDGTWREVTLAFNNENSGLRLKVTDTSGGAYGTLMPDLSGSIYIRDVVLTTTHANGYVETWYDQSGNGNDATQTVAASQPKIVDAGVLVSGGIDFDGVDDQLTTSSFISGSNFSAFSVLKCTDISSNENQSWNFTDNASEFYGLTFNRNAAGNVAFASTTPDSDLGEESYTGNKKLFSTFSGTSNSYYSNGTESVLVKLGRHSPSTGNTIGSQGTSGRYLEGSIEEIIVYNSDQSANREAIEANINNHYSIY